MSPQKSVHVKGGHVSTARNSVRVLPSLEFHKTQSADPAFFRIYPPQMQGRQISPDELAGIHLPNLGTGTKEYKLHPERRERVTTPLEPDALPKQIIIPL